jgi:molecular chaperone GrpE
MTESQEEIKNDIQSQDEVQNIAEHALSQDDIDAKANDVNHESADADSIDQFHKLNEEIAELKNKYLLAQAELSNTQKRNQEELKKTREYCISKFATDLLVVKDYLEMALKDNTDNVATIKMGVELTLKELNRVFESNKIQEIVTNQKDKLDPNLHQALSIEEVEGQDPNTVVAVLQKGYQLNGRVIRPASVKVSK